MDALFGGMHFRSIFCVSLFGAKRVIYSSSLITSSTLGLVGSVFQLFLWIGYLRRHDARHKPSSNPHIVFNLAVANALSCLASLTLGISLVLIKLPVENGLIPTSVAIQDIYWIFPIQVLSDFGYFASAVWTLMYLIDVCLQVHKVNCHVAMYHAVGWGLSAIFTVIVQMLRFSGKDSVRRCTPADELPDIVIVWISLIIAVAVACSAILCMIDRQVKADVCLLSNAYTANQRKLMQTVRGKFLFFLVVFFFCWISTFIRGILVLGDFGTAVQEPLCFTEAILNPVQGAFNYFIFTPLRTKPNPTISVHADRKSPLLPHGTIQRLYGTSFDSSIASSVFLGRGLPMVSSFHFTPCFPIDINPFLTSFHDSSTENNSFDDTLKVGNLLGEAEYF